MGVVVVASVGKLRGRGPVARWKLVVVVGFSHGGSACPVATLASLVKVFSELKVRTNEPCIQNVLCQKAILSSRYILHVVIALSPLLMKVGLRSTFSYSPLLCCWFTEKTKSP